MELSAISVRSTVKIGGYYATAHKAALERLLMCCIDSARDYPPQCTQPKDNKASSPRHKAARTTSSGLRTR